MFISPDTQGDSWQKLVVSNYVHSLIQLPMHMEKKNIKNKLLLQTLQYNNAILTLQGT